MPIYISFKINFLIDHHCKIQTEISDLLEKGRIYWSSCTVIVEYLRKSLLLVVLHVLWRRDIFHIQQTYCNLNQYKISVFVTYLLLNFRCVFDTMCFAYQYIEQNNLNCRLIHRSSLVGQKFVSNETKIYLKGKYNCILVNNLQIKKQGRYRQFNSRVFPILYLKLD